VLFTAGGIATPADAAMMMQLGAEGVFVGSGIFKSGNPAQRAEAIVKATTFYDDPDVIAKVSRGLGEAMVGINVDDIPVRTASPSAAGEQMTGHVVVRATALETGEHWQRVRYEAALQESPEVDGLVVERTVGRAIGQTVALTADPLVVPSPRATTSTARVA
jgi:imidazole glycerol phosphate synthase subunit HisF